MIMSPNEVRQYCSRHPDVLAMVILEEKRRKTKKEKILHFGPWKKSELLF
jgi:hypothetical protein